MTKIEAAEKVAKLRRLAERAGTPAEAENARAQAKKLVEKYQLGSGDLTNGIKAAAFDALLDELGKFAELLPGPVFALINQAKRDVTNQDKAKTLELVIIGVRMAHLFKPHDKDLKAMSSTLDKVLAEHNVIM